MSILMLTAAGLMALTVLVHVFAGGPEIMPSIRKSDLPAAIRAVMDVIWHGVTVVLVVMAGALAWLAFYPNQALLWAVCAIQIGFALLFIWYGLRTLGNVKTMPQWVIFLLVPAMALAA